MQLRSAALAGLVLVVRCNCGNAGDPLTGVPDGTGGGGATRASGGGSVGAGGGSAELGGGTGGGGFCVAPGDACGGELEVCCTGSCTSQNTCPETAVPDAGVPDAGAADAGCGPDGSSCGVAALCQPLGQCMAGTCVQPPPTMCGTGDIQVTLTWDDQGVDMELHLIRPGGHLNDAAGGSDCTWTTCVGKQPDWGVIGDPTDDPHKDVDNTGHFGPENIYLNMPQTGDFAVYVEHWNPAGLPSTVQVTVSIHQQPVFMTSISSFDAHHLWDVARIHWPAGTVTAGTGGDIDCTGNWQMTTAGCDLVLP